MARIKHFRDKCVGCTYCIGVAPEFWRMNEVDGRCDLVGSVARTNCYELEIFDDEIQRNKRAASVCPTKCIRVDV